MAKSIAEYTAEVSKSYDNSRQALQKQIDAISGNLAQTQKQINENYANQQNQLNAQRDQAAEAASLRAAGSGGSFGGAANIANRKYYEQSFVPAQTQLNTNQSQALENAQSQANNNRLTLETQLASMMDEISRSGLARYYDALEKEREDAYRQQQLALQKRQIAAAEKANTYWNNATSQDKYGAIISGDENNRDYQFRNNATGGAVKLGTYIQQYGGNFNNRAQDYIKQMANSGDAGAAAVLNILKYNPNKKLAANTGSSYKANNYKYLSSYDNDVLNRLGLKLV